MSKSLQYTGFAVALSIFASGCVTVGNTRITYNELCTGERPKCAPDGEFYNFFEPPRPSVRREANGDYHKEMWAEYLGRLVAKERSTDTAPCKTLVDNDISIDFSHNIDVNLISETNLEAQIKQEIDAELSNIALTDKPNIVENMTIDIISELKKNAFTKAHYKVVNIIHPVLDGIRNAKLGDGEPYECRQKIINSGMHFIRSIAIIGSEGKLSFNQKKEIQAVIDASLSGAHLEGGGSIDADLSAGLSLKISRRTERTVSTVTENHTGVYAYGYWGPDFVSVDYKSVDFNKVFEVSPRLLRKLK